MNKTPQQLNYSEDIDLMLEYCSMTTYARIQLKKPPPITCPLKITLWRKYDQLFDQTQSQLNVKLYRQLEITLQDQQLDQLWSNLHQPIYNQIREETRTPSIIQRLTQWIIKMTKRIIKTLTNN